MSGFTWVPFYMEFAGKLLTYQFDRPAMVQKVIKAYAQAELKMPRLDSTDHSRGYGPVHRFGSVQ